MPRHAHRAVAAWCVVFFALVASMCAQEAKAPERTGFPQDWSQHHIVFSRDGLARHPDLISREPRIQQQVMQHWQVPKFGVFQSADPLRAAAKSSGQHRDWSQALGGHLLFNTFPAKFSFFPDAPPSCINDYVVFGLGSVSAVGVGGGHPNLVGFNNLYVDATGEGDGLCEGTAPALLFGYNITTVTGGHITTSPILSLDGTKVGFVESVPRNVGLGVLTPSTIFHVVTWNAADGGTLAAGVVPSSMTSLTISATASDTRSSPWIDYDTDIVYVGTDDGSVHKITGVFRGTPTQSGAPWPVSVSPPSFHLSPPVRDPLLGLLMVGSANGNLYQINTATGVIANTVPVGGGPSAGIAAAPIVDVTNGTTFVVTANVGDSAALVQFRTATLTQISLAPIGIGAAGGTALNLYEPAFSNNYFTAPSTGVARICGTGPDDTRPYQYAFGFHGNILNESPSFSAQLSTSLTARCTGWTEFFNPNVPEGGTDYFFFGLTQDCTSITGTAISGCVAEITGTDTTPVTATITGGPSGIVVDNYSTDAQASSIYFTAWKLQEAYKFTQDGLQ